MPHDLDGAEVYALDDTTPRDDTPHQYPSLDHHITEEDEQIHLASLAEKKRLWWRNAVINACFIASW